MIFINYKYTIQVSYIQAIILKLFNTQKDITYQQLKEIINIDEEDLKTHIMSFLHAKDKILIKNPDVIFFIQ